jgi:hypothetical protein
MKNLIASPVEQKVQQEYQVPHSASKINELSQDNPMRVQRVSSDNPRTLPPPPQVKASPQVSNHTQASSVTQVSPQVSTHPPSPAPDIKKVYAENQHLRTENNKKDEIIDILLSIIPLIFVIS